MPLYKNNNQVSDTGSSCNCNHFTSLVVIHKETDPAIVLSMFMFSFNDPAIVLSMFMFSFIFVIVCCLFEWKRISAGFFFIVCTVLEIQLSERVGCAGIILLCYLGEEVAWGRLTSLICWSLLLLIWK